MSYGSRLLIIAVGGCLILLLALHSMPQQDDGDYYLKSKYSDGENEQANRKDAVTISTPTQIDREKTVDAEWDKPNCRSPKSHDEADLCQQIRVAAAAETTLVYGVWQLILSIATVLGLALTVLYAKKSTDAAIEAARAATNAVEITNSLERPRIFVVPVNAPEGLHAHKERGFSYRILNYGRTPAILISCGIKMTVIKDFSAGPDYTSVKAHKTGMVIAPPDLKNKERSIPSEYHRITPLSIEELGDLAVGGDLCIFGFIEYRSTRETHKTGFCFRADKEGWYNTIGGEKYNYET